MKEELFKDYPVKTVRELFKPHFNGLWIANFGFSLDSAAEALAAGTTDLVSFGRLFVANPDLVERV